MSLSFEEEETRLQAVTRLQLLDRPEEERFKRIIRLVRRHFHAAASSITLVDHERQFMVSQQGLGRRETPRKESICSMVVEQDSPLVIADISENSRTREFHRLVDDLKLRFYAGVPLHSPEGLPLGSLCVLDHIPRRFSESDIEALNDFASIVEDEMFLRRIDEANQDLVSQVERLRTRAFVDALTGVWNRGALFDLLHRELERAKRTSDPFSIAMLDIDHFKAVNDTYGHQVGDEVLRELCQRLQKSIRSYDAIGRYGGEEFVVVFPQAGIDRAASQGERLRKAIEVKPFTLEADSKTVTVSVGVTTSTDDDTVQELLKRADGALYQAKGQGRNCVVVA